ncbi:MAG: hypothetical protein HY518_01365 [Candidatus Aenigmarchaeota archaeon]|nr:hypothetical protein [Candidatus Aenigmarchaeota archaeon]
MSKTILPEDAIEFLDQEEFRAHKIIVVGEEYDLPRSGRAHVRARCFAKNAYCYEEVTVVPLE